MSGEIIEQSSILEILGLFFLAIAMIWYYDLLISNYELRYRNNATEMQLNNQIKYYDMILSYQDIVNSIKHDLNKHLNTIEGMIKTGSLSEATDYISGYTKTIKQNIKLVFTPHPVVSSILSYCRERAEKANVELQLDISIPEMIVLNQVDITIILGNTIDNALEALEKLMNEPRRLWITLKERDYFLFFEIINTYDPITAKQKIRNRTTHGYGLENVKTCVKKYDGDFRIDDKAGEYCVTILIPIKAKTMENITK